MNKSVEDILTEALNMPSIERAVIADRLIVSLDNQYDSEIELAWQQEIQKRISKVDNEEVTCLPWEEIRQKLRENNNASS